MQIILEISLYLEEPNSDHNDDKGMKLYHSKTHDLTPSPKYWNAQSISFKHWNLCRITGNAIKASAGLSGTPSLRPDSRQTQRDLTIVTGYTAQILICDEWFRYITRATCMAMRPKGDFRTYMYQLIPSVLWLEMRGKRCKYDIRPRK